jgi:hypothetical protein
MVARTDLSFRWQQLFLSFQKSRTLLQLSAYDLDAFLALDDALIFA